MDRRAPQRALGRRARGATTRAPTRTRRRICGSTPRRRARALGWAPRWDLDQALASIGQWYKAFQAGPTCARTRSQIEDSRRASAGMPGSVPMSAPRRPCRFCCAPSSTHTFADLGMSPLANSYLTADQLEQHGAVLPAARARLRSRASWCSSRSSRRRRRSSRDYAYFSSYSTSWLEHAGATSRCDDRALRPRTRHRRWSSSRATTATCCSTSSSAACRCWASSRRPTWPRSPSESGIPTLVAFFGDADGHASSPPEAAGRPVIGNNVLAHVPDLNDFVAGMKIAARAATA